MFLQVTLVKGAYCIQLLLVVNTTADLEQKLLYIEIHFKFGLIKPISNAAD